MLIFTSCINNYIPKARILASSLKAHHPDWTFCLLLGEAPPEGFRLEDEPFDRLLGFDALGIDDYPSWLFRHRVVEICTAAKGPALWHFLEREQQDKVMYLDPDIMVLGSLAPLEDLLDRHALLLTPHQLAPQTTAQSIVDNELCAMQFGVFNLGFAAAARRGDGLAFARWWRDRLLEYCYDDRPNGLFTDQRWCDLAPAFFPDLAIVRDPGCNAASWNLTDRVITRSETGEYLANGGPLRFYHFTGFDSGAGDVMTGRYAKDMPAVHALWADYKAKLAGSGQAALGKRRWAHAVFNNGTLITDAMRLLYRKRPDVQKVFPDPFVTPGYLDWFLTGEDRGPRSLSGRLIARLRSIGSRAHRELRKHGGFPAGLPGLALQTLRWLHQWGLLGVLRKIWGQAPEPAPEVERLPLLRYALTPPKEGAPSPLASLLGPRREVVCLLEHDWGGGAGSYGDARAQRLLDEGQAVIRLRYDTAGAFIRLTAQRGESSLVCQLGNLRELEAEGFPPISRIIVNELANWQYSPDDPLGRATGVLQTVRELTHLARRSKAPLEFLFHDYYSICPRVFLLTTENRFCRLELSEGFCDKCALNGLPFSIREWRDTWADLLALADRLVFFSESSRDLVRKVLPLRDEQIALCPHEVKDFGVRLRIPSDGPMRVAVVGDIQPHKGRAIVLALARQLAERMPEASLVVFGDIHLSRAPWNVTLAGPYRRDDLPRLLEEYKVTAGFFSSIWPETFSYVTHELASLGLPLVCFDLGAPGDYVKTLPNSRVVREVRPKTALDALLELDALRRGDKAMES
jgi:glycosyltransferase involved in cell wall biosynthesis